MARCPCRAAPETPCAPPSTRLHEKPKWYWQRHHQSRDMALGIIIMLQMWCGGMAAWSQMQYEQLWNKMASFTKPSNWMHRGRLIFCTQSFDKTITPILFAILYKWSWFVFEQGWMVGSLELALENRKNKSWRNDKMQFFYICGYDKCND